MAIKPGSLGNFGNSMAAEIEAQLHAMLIADGLPGLPGLPGEPAGSAQDLRDRRRLFVAIARGVVKHLKLHEADIVMPYFDHGIPASTSAKLTVTGI